MPAAAGEGPELLLQDGVAGWVDAGSAGADNIDQIVAVARGGPQIGRVVEEDGLATEVEPKAPECFEESLAITFAPRC